MNEATLTDADMKQREKIVKSMKKNFKDFRKRYGADAKNVMYATATKMAMKEDLQGSSVAKVPYRELDMDNLVQDAIKDIPEDDGPHTSSIGDMDAINFQTVAKPEDVVNQPNNEGNRESTAVTSTRKTGKPFKAIRSRGPGSYGAEDLSGAVASVAIGEAVKDEADKGEYDYEGDMAKSSLRTIARNAQMMHDMLDENTNLPEWVASKITLAEDYIVAAAQYMQSEMSEEVELEEGNRENKDKKNTVVQNIGKKLTPAGYSDESPDRATWRKLGRSSMKKEEVELEEGEVKTANKASKNAYMKKQGAGDVARGRLKNRATQKSDPYKYRTSMDRAATMAHAERQARLDSYGRNQNDRTKKVAWDNLPDHLKKIGSDFRPSDVAKAKAAGKLPLKKANEEVEQIDEYQKGLFNPPAGFTKKGIEKGGGVKTTYHYKGKSNTPSGATMKMGGVTVPLGKTPTKRRVKEEMGLEENQYSLPAGSTMKGNAPVKPKSYLEKRFGHLKPGESASLKGDPKKVMNKTNEEQEQQVETPNGSNN